MQKFLLAILLIASTFFIFKKSKNFDFVWKDQELIVNNPSISPPTRKGFKDIWANPQDKSYTPVADSVLIALNRLSMDSNNAQLTPENESSFIPSPKNFHTFSLFLHILNTLLIFIVLGQLVKKPIASFLGAGLFAMHPLQVESVAWISSMNILLATTFSLFSIMFYLRYSRKQDSSNRNQKNPIYFYYAGTISFILGCLTNPAIIFLPFAILIIEKLVPKEYSFFAPRKPMMPLIFWMFIALPFFIWTLNLQNYSVANVSIFKRPLIAADAFTFYLYKILLPINIGPDYGHAPNKIFSQWWGYIAWLTPVAIFTSLLYWKNKIRAWVAAGFSILILALLPYLGIYRFDFQATSTVSDRFVYLGLLGLSTTVALIINSSRKFSTKIFVAAIIATFSFLSYRQLDIWSDNVALWEHTLKVNPESPIAHKVLADKFKEKGDIEKAQEHYRLVLESDNSNPEIMLYLAELAFKNKNLIEAESLLSQAINLNPEYGDALHMLGLISAEKKDFKKANDYLTQSVAIEPKNATFLADAGSNLIKLEQFSEAIPYLKKSINMFHQKNLERNTAEPQAQLGYALYKTDQKELGLIHLETALKLNQNQPRANLTLANIFFEQKQLDIALERYLKALENYPEDENVLFNIGTILTDRKKYNEANNYFNKLISLNKKLPLSYTFLGKNQFSLRELSDAQNNLNKALELDPEIADAYYYLGDIERWKGLSASSLTYFYKAIKIDPKHSLAHYRLGSYFMKENNKKQALYHFNKSLSSDPENTTVAGLIKKLEKPKNPVNNNVERL